MPEGRHDTAAPLLLVQVIGTARGNPGLAGAGIVIIDESGVVRDRIARYLGSASALEAQLQALVLALRYARRYAPANLSIELGNETVVRQLSGEHGARHPIVLRTMSELDGLLASFNEASYRLGRPADMAEAERLADLAVDTRLRPLPAYDRALPD